MAVIVEERETKRRFVLVGAGYGAYMSERPGLFLGNWLPDQKSGTHPMVAVCTHDREIGWFYSDQLRVVTVDGKTPADLLSPGRGA